MTTQKFSTTLLSRVLKLFVIQECASDRIQVFFFVTRERVINTFCVERPARLFFRSIHKIIDLSEDSIGINVPTINNEVKVTKADMEFDFGFDPERDAHLIAKDFEKHISDDEVLFEFPIHR